MVTRDITQEQKGLAVLVKVVASSLEWLVWMPAVKNLKKATTKKMQASHE